MLKSASWLVTLFFCARIVFYFKVCAWLEIPLVDMANCVLPARVTRERIKALRRYGRRPIRGVLQGE